MDLDQFGTVEMSESGVEMELRHPGNGEVIRQKDGTAVTIKLAGPDSRRCRDQTTFAAEKRIEMMARTGRERLSPDEEIEEDVQLLVALTMGWTGVSFGGVESMELTPENAAAFYRRFPAFRKQASKFINSYANFMKASAAS